LDLFCGAGGASQGYKRAGFHVTGVDNRAQPHYAGDRFIRADAMTFSFEGFDAIHASPPCQAYTKARNLQGNAHPDLVGPMRERLIAAGVPYVIENVIGAPLINPLLLCGMMFGLNVYRHRLFESSVPLPFLLHPMHHKPHVKMGRPVKEGDIVQVVGHFSNIGYARRAMDIPWMTQKELAQAIPPGYTEFVGRELLAHIRTAERVA
jgi:DNA (cytosine-5)-methyltransferase 1